MKKLVSIVSVALLLFVCVFSSCKSKKEQAKKAESNIIYSEQLAKQISFVTSGDVHFDDYIQVIFNNPVVEENEVSSSPKDVFEFSPKISGRAVWKTRSVLEFIPDNNLPMRSTIQGKLNLQKLSSAFKEQKIEDLQFNLSVQGRDIKSFNGSLELKDRDNPLILIYRGVVSFTEKTELEKVQKASKIRSSKDVTLNWSKIDDYNFAFSSSEIKRTDDNQEYTVKIDKKPLELEYDYTETFVVSPLEKMTANEFRTDETGRVPRIRIIFSDELDLDQNIDGLINVEPLVKFEVKKLGNSAVLDGSFKFGEKYKVTVHKGIRSRWGTKTEDEAIKELQFSDIAPQVEFVSDGIILPTSNNKKIQFYTTNLKRVHLQVKKVYANKIGHFIQSQQLSSSKTRNKDFTNDYSSNVGVIVKSQTIELGNEQNEWLLNEFDLSELFGKYDDGLFLIRINFTPEDVSKPINGNILDYIQDKGQIYKPVFLSNLGMTLKETDGSVKVFVTDIITGKPLSGVTVSLLDWDGDVRSSNTTNSYGVVNFSSDYYRYVLAQKGNQTTALNKDEMKWSNSGFEVGGVRDNYDGVKGFIYTERGVYRPGDSVNVCFIVRNSSNTFPENHPASITVQDPNYNTVFEQTSVKATDGFYRFGFGTKESDPTGNYKIRINAGGSWFYKDLQIETVVADQLDVRVKPLKKQVVWTDKSVDFEVNSKYLFGAPAANLKAEVSIEVHPVSMQFPKYANYTFTRSGVEFKSFTQSVLKKELDADGNLSGSWIIPSLGDVPSALKLKIVAKVIEKGGQTNEGWNALNMYVYPNYVGIQDPSGYGYYKTGQEIKFPVVLVDANGKKIVGKQLQYRIYRNDKSWWYQYNSRYNYELKYKEDSQTSLEKAGTIKLFEGSNYVNYTPMEDGEYLLEVSDGGSGHCASIFFRSYQYSSMPGGDKNEGTLALKLDKAKYTSSETAKIMLPNPKQGNVLVTIEKGDEILDWFWVDPSESKSDELIISVPLKKSMLPNVYATVSVIQPHDQTVNDRPIRMFGIIPIMIEDSDTKLQFNIDVPETLAPEKDFEVKVSTLSNKQAQFTIAVVDEGLLSLTQFRTPRPWNEFYKKIGLFVRTYDVFSHVISANKGDVFQTFAIGGSDEVDFRESQLSPFEGLKRFKPVCMFKGPLTTDANGRATVKFRMPSYNGAVRIMVVGTDKGSFGNAEKTIPVKSEIIMQPSIPRTLNPGDEFILPVSLFKTNSKIKNAQFTLKVEGPLEVLGSNKVSVDFTQKDEADIQFKVKVKEAVGQAKITITGNAGTTQVQNETDIMVVPTSLRLYDKLTQKIEKGKSLSFKVPAIGLKGTNNASLDISVFPNMDFGHRLKWLIRYPYGCIEQTTSAVFPQLYLKKMGYFPKDDVNEIDENINNGINRLQKFMLSGGGFSYWPGSRTESEWGTNYASHFLIEARKMGYSIPDYLYNGAVNRLANLARQHSGHLTTRVNRAFILALVGKQPMAEMNLLMENDLKNMNNVEKWMLATAYYLSGAENISEQILMNANTTTAEYDPFSYCYGSKYRDDAVILYCTVLMKKMETAEIIAKSIAKALSTKEYMSTHSTGYMLLALGKYFDAAGISASKGQIINGTVTLANGEKIHFNEDGRVSIPIKNNFNQNIQITLSNETKVDAAFATLSWDGVPLKDEAKAMQKNLELQVNWYDENGNTVNPQSLKQGATFYGKFSVKNTSPLSNVTEIALMQIIPSGWQIVNTRLNNTLLPDWTREWNLNKEDYLDIRDDRIMWFFDLRDKETLDFVVKLNCVNAGNFWLPGTMVEAMYNNDFKAAIEGKKVYVEAFK